jgi:hypothetical protein
LLQRLRDVGAPLIEYAGVEPMYGVKTGLNEAFFVDTVIKDQLVATDPRSADLLKPLLRGQDIHRWACDRQDLWLIFTRHGTDIDAYPAIKAHLLPFRRRLEPKPSNWEGDKWPGRKPGAYRWWEIQDNVAYFELFEQPKIFYSDITWSAQFARDASPAFGSNTTYFLPSGDPWVVACLNSPLGWWFAWRGAQHGKDEALRYFNTFVEHFPIARGGQQARTRAAALIGTLESIANDRHAAQRVLRDWLAVTWEILKPPVALVESFALSSDEYAQALRAALPARRRNLSSAAVASIRTEYAATVAPIVARLREATRLENELSRLVNEAYGLTQEDERLMWATAPPRMPLTPPGNSGEDGPTRPEDERSLIGTSGA